MTPDRIYRNALYAKYRQPAAKSWIRKLETTHYLRQTPNERKIHTHEHKNIQNIQTIWMETWGRHREYHQNPKEQTQQERRKIEAHLYMNMTTKNDKDIYRNNLSQVGQIPRHEPNDRTRALQP